MYRTKGRAKGGVNFFDPGIGHKAAERAKLEQRLRLAIRDHRLCCAYQPQVDFRSQSVVGLEVLLRWRDEEGVIHAPGDFVNLAVELGLMDENRAAGAGADCRGDGQDRRSFRAAYDDQPQCRGQAGRRFSFMRSLAEALGATGYPSDSWSN